MTDLKQPILVVGTVRSGTTLLAGCLGRHPDILFAQYELTPEWCDLAGIAIASPGVGHVDCPPLEATDVTPDIARRVRRGFSRILERDRDHDGVRFLNKNPHLSNKLPFARAIFPDAQLVVASRDIRSTVLSTQMLLLRLRRDYDVVHYLPHDANACWSCSQTADSDWEPDRVFPGGSISVLAEYWLRTYERVEQTVSGFPHVHLVRHRDLVAHPEETLNRVLDVLGLSPYPMAQLPRIDRARNRRWEKLLARPEREELDAFIRQHEESIRRLRYADITL